MQKSVFTIICYLILSYSINLNGQFHYDKSKVSQETKDYIEEISNVGYYALLGINTGQFEMDFTDDSIFKSLPILDIRYLSNHPNPYIRAYAFKYFNEKAPIQQSLNLLKQHFLDTVLISEGTYCLTDKRQVFDVMYSEFIMLANSEDSMYNYYFFSIDSFIIKNIGNRYCNALDYAIFNIGNYDLFYQDIKNLALKNYPSAIITLGKYHKESDIEIILKSIPNLDYFYQDDYYPNGYCLDNVKLKAIENFTNEKFEEFLTQVTNKLLNNEKKIDFGILCGSISAQKSDFSVTQLLRLYDKAINSFNSEFAFEKCIIVELAEALNKNLNPKFEELSIRVAKEYSLINNQFINYFSNKNPDLVEDLCKNFIERQVNKIGHSEALLFNDDCEFIQSEDNLIYDWLIIMNISFLKDKLDQAERLENNLFKHRLYGLFISNKIEHDFKNIFKEINNDLDHSIDLFDVRFFYRNCDSEFKSNLKNYLESKGHDTSIYFDNW